MSKVRFTCIRSYVQIYCTACTHLVHTKPLRLRPIYPNQITMLLTSFLRFIPLLLMFSYGTGLAGQNLKIVYEKTTHTPPSRLYDYMPAENFNEVSRYTFTFSGGKSRFRLDSLKISGNSAHDGWKAISAKDVVKDWATNKLYYRRGNMQKGYALLNTMDLTEASRNAFKIVPEYREILGIKCQKMVHEMGGELWFTTSIPYADGPFPFASPTPGLVLLYRDESFEYRAVDLRVGAYTVEIPKYKFVDEARDVSLSLDELRSADGSEVIIIDQATPNGVWMKFDGK